MNYNDLGTSAPNATKILRVTLMARQSSPSGFRFTRLKLTNWRNFRSVDIKLQPRAFIVGPNASGKSNLLDAIRFLSELAKPGSGGLQAALKAREGFSAVRCLHSRSPSHVEIEVWIGNDQLPEAWHYLLRVNTWKKESMPTVIAEQVDCNGTRVNGRERGANEEPLTYSQTYLEQVAESQNFQELSRFLSSCRYLHVVPQIVRERARGKSEGDDPYGGDLLRRMKNVAKKTREPRLRRISKALTYAVPQFGDIELKDDSDGVPHLLASYNHWRNRAAKQSESLFSDGTLRLIGLLWSIAEGGGPLLLEEPELSLNDGVIRELPSLFLQMQRLSRRQVIATTHSDAMLESSIGLKEVHRIIVDSNGSRVETASEDKRIVAQVEHGMTVGEAILPLLRPREIDKLGTTDVAA